jgi:hypothetical protein
VTIAKTLAPPDPLASAGSVFAQTPAGGTVTLPTRTVILKLSAGSDVNVRIPPRAVVRPTLKPAIPGPVPDVGGSTTRNN